MELHNYRAAWLRRWTLVPFEFKPIVRPPICLRNKSLRKYSKSHLLTHNLTCCFVIQIENNDEI